MTIQQLSQTEREALFDLALLPITTSGQLPAAGDPRLDILSSMLGLSGEATRPNGHSATLSRISQRTKSPDEAAACLVELARAFTKQSHRVVAIAALKDLLVLEHLDPKQQDTYLASVAKALDNLPSDAPQNRLN
jgi:hypothetical protein